MTDTYKNLGQVYPTVNTLTVAYTVPASTSTVVSSICVCNQSSQSTTWRMTHAIAGEADTVAQNLFAPLGTLLPYETRWIVGGPTMATTDVLRVYSANGQVSFNIYGLEVS